MFGYEIIEGNELFVLTLKTLKCTLRKNLILVEIVTNKS